MKPINTLTTAFAMLMTTLFAFLIWHAWNNHLNNQRIKQRVEQVKLKEI